MIRTPLPPKLRQIQSLPPFEACTPAELAFVAHHLSDHHAAPGDHLTVEGRSGREWVVIVEGTAVVRSGADEIARLGPGDAFGEIALLDDGPRTATVVADTAVVSLVASLPEFRAILDVVPSVGRRVLTTMATRLRDADERSFRAVSTT